MDNNTFIQYLKGNNILLSEELEMELCSYIEGLMNYRSVSSFYQLSTFVHLPNLGRITMRYIERCFVMVAETENFLELDYNFVAKIFSSPQLEVSSEYEVCCAAFSWLNYNCLERNKHAKDILVKLRLPLLTDHQLDYVMYRFSLFRDNKQCLQLIEKISAHKNLINWKNFKFCTTNRHCNQNNFDILALEKTVVDALKFIRLDENKKEVKCVKETPRIPVDLYEFTAVYLKGVVYMFGCIEGNKLTVKQYTLETDSWYTYSFFGIEVKHFCACALIDDIYLLGGHLFHNNEITITNNCLKLLQATRYGSLHDISPMNDIRSHAGCTAFEGRVIVSGGTADDPEGSNTVEVHDKTYNEWSYMPSMIHKRQSHSLVAVKNKLFAVGGGGISFEVYDSCCKKFVVMKLPPKLTAEFDSTAVLMGSRIVVLQRFSESIAFYDVEKNQWSEETYERGKHYNFEECIRLPQI